MMKKHNSVTLFLAFLFCTATMAFGGVADDFIALGHEYELNALSPLEEGASQELGLNTRERTLAGQLLSSENDLGTVVNRAAEVEAGLLARLISRMQFEMTQEGRTALQGHLNGLVKAYTDMTDVSKSKKIAYIYGREVDLKDGEWNTSPDGRRFWVSNEYPDIILSAADYRRYMATATTVED